MTQRSHREDQAQSRAGRSHAEADSGRRPAHTTYRADGVDLAKLAVVSLGVVVYSFAIGWVVTAVRLAAARVPATAALPVIADKNLLATGVRTVVIMAIVFGAMCAVAYAVHAWTWSRHRADWHNVVRVGRAAARATRPPAADAEIGDQFVRVIAGFNVGVLAVTLGLAVGRLVKPLIDQAIPGQWWDLVAPWAVAAILLALLFAALGPLCGGRAVHAVLWAAVVAVALVCSAPIGLLLLTWAGIATFGRVLGRHQSRPGTKVEFALSPLPWILLTIYALVALCYYAAPPVSFPQAFVTTGQGVRVGGYVATSGARTYLVTCTPLASATSTDEGLQSVTATTPAGVRTTTTSFVVDTGARPSLPTLALHALGVDTATPAWIRPELRTRQPTCAGSPPPRSSVGTPAPTLGTGVIAGPASLPAQAQDGEPPIEQTSPGIAALARQFQPTILVSTADRFWPMSVGAVLDDIGSNGQPTCLHHVVNRCAISDPGLGDLREQGSAPTDFLQYPATPPLDKDPTGQLDAFLRGQLGRPVAVPSTPQWLADPGQLNPWRTAQLYFYYAGRADPAHWPAPNRQISGDLIALQYWFFYPYNYYPTAATPALMNEAPIAGDVVNTDLHQGDWEHITVLVDRRTRTPEWLYMARHSDEGQYLPWDSPQLTFDDGHPIVQAAYGGHPTYNAGCGPRLRYAHGINGLAADWLACGTGRFAFRAATTPLVDIAKAPWACWEGHFGVATASEDAQAKTPESSVRRAVDAYVLVAGPRSPLWQAENGRLTADGSAVDKGPCVASGGPAAAENAAIRSGISAAAGSSRPRAG